MIAERVQAVRHVFGFSLRQLEQRAGVARATVGGWETRDSRRADPASVRAVEEVLGIPRCLLSYRLTANQLAGAPGVVTLPATTHRVTFATRLTLTTTGGVRPTTGGPTSIGFAITTAPPSTSPRRVAVLKAREPWPNHRHSGGISGSFEQ